MGAREDQGQAWNMDPPRGRGHEEQRHPTGPAPESAPSWRTLGWAVSGSSERQWRLNGDCRQSSIYPLPWGPK